MGLCYYFGDRVGRRLISATDKNGTCVVTRSLFTTYLFDQEQQIGFVISEVGETTSSGYSESYTLTEMRNTTLLMVQAYSDNTDRRNVVTQVDALEAEGYTVFSSVTPGTPTLLSFDDPEKLMEGVGEVIKNKRLILELRQKAFGEQINKAYNAWGSW